MMKFLLLICCLLAVSTLSAQNDLPTGQIEVVKDFEVRLTESKKIGIIPQPIVRDTTIRQYEYVLKAPSPEIEYIVPELKPLAIEPEQKPAYYPFFAKAGYGSPNSLLGLLSYDHTTSESLSYGVDLRHLSADSKKIPLQKFSDSRGRINGRYLISESAVLDAYVNGHFQNIYFYGAEEIPANPESLRRKFNRYDIHASVSNEMAQQPLLHYDAFLQYMFDKDDLGSRERTIRLGGGLHTLLGKKEFPVGIKFVSDVSKLKQIQETIINNILIEPHISFYTEDLKVHLGTIALLKKNENDILPALRLSYDLFPLVTLYAGWEGQVVKNNFHELSIYNPYLVTRLDSINNMLSRRIFGGIRGKSGMFNYEFTGGYSSFQNMVFFLQDEDDHEQFTPVYDDGSFIGVEASLSFEPLDDVMLRSNAFGRFYSPEHEEKPWHRPLFGIDAQATYDGGDDLYHVSILFHGENGVPYRTIGGTITNLDPLLHLSLHGDYFFTQSIGAFAELNNILGNNRERWAGYPSYGFNAKAGIQVRW
jgi:hypothetical protein